MMPEIITPAACSEAVGGNMSDSYDIAASMLAAAMSMRILDDLEDGDKTESLYHKIGVARTLNYVDAYRTLGYKILVARSQTSARYLKIMEEFTTCYLIVLAGQDRDLMPFNINWEEAWKTIEMKTAYIHATAACLGAMAATDNEVWIQACKKYGYHLGLAIQLFNDMDGIWSPEGGMSDLQQGKITLPVLYALQCEHEDREELTQILYANQVSQNVNRIKEILEKVEAKEYLIWSALKQRESGLEAIRILPESDGRDILEAHFTGMFGDIDQLVTNSKFDTISTKGFSTLDTTPRTADDKGTARVESDALIIRRKLRTQFT